MLHGHEYAYATGRRVDCACEGKQELAVTHVTSLLDALPKRYICVWAIDPADASGTHREGWAPRHCSVEATPRRVKARQQLQEEPG
jgi:hypothetical protein